MRSILVGGFCLSVSLYAQSNSAPSTCISRDAIYHPDAETRELFSKVRRLTRKGESAEAFSLVTEALSVQPENPRLQVALSEVLYRQGKLREAIDALNHANELDPCDPEAHYFAWRVNATAGQYLAAQKQLEIAHELSPNNALIQRMWSNMQEVLPPGVIADTPPHFDFYAKHIDCEGIPIRAGSVVSAATLVEVCGYVHRMLANLPNVRENLIARGGEIHITGEDQRLSDLPEFRDMRGEPDFTHPGETADASEKIDIDSVAIGLAGVYSACPEDRMTRTDHPRGTVCIHEFAHEIMNYGFDDKMRDEIREQYKSSTKKGLWKGAYAAINADEFWADVSRWYFGSSGGTSKMIGAIPQPGPEGLKNYDPRAYALAERLYSGRKQPRVIHMHEAKVVSRAAAFEKSTRDDAEILFVNNTGKRCRIYSIEQDGHLEDHNWLEPYSRKTMPSFIEAQWIIEDPVIRTQTIYRVDYSESEAVINAAPQT